MKTDIKIERTQIENAVVWGYIWCKDGSEVDLENTPLRDLLAMDPRNIKEIGESELGNEANIVVDISKTESVTLCNTAAVKRFIKVNAN